MTESDIISLERVSIKGKNNITLLRCPKFWPPAPPRGMNFGARTYGMKADPPRYPWTKYECFLIRIVQDSLLVKRRNDNHSPGPVIRELVPRYVIIKIYSFWETLMQNWSNSMNVTEARMNEQTDKHTNGQMERRKLNTPWHKCRMYNESNKLHFTCNSSKLCYLHYLNFETLPSFYHEMNLSKK